jgi:uncharacterized membrane protein (DUF485 family)
MDHGPAVELGEDHSAGKKSKLGVWMFVIYSIVYGGFVAIGVLNYELMGKEVIGELNLSVVYGFGLIIFAIVLGLIYNALCTKYENKMNHEEVKS